MTSPSLVLWHTACGLIDCTVFALWRLQSQGSFTCLFASCKTQPAIRPGDAANASAQAGTSPERATPPGMLVCQLCNWGGASVMLAHQVPKW